MVKDVIVMKRFRALHREREFSVSNTIKTNILAYIHSIYIMLRFKKKNGLIFHVNPFKIFNTYILQKLHGHC